MKLNFRQGKYKAANYCETYQTKNKNDNKKVIRPTHPSLYRKHALHKESKRGKCAGHFRYVGKADSDELKKNAHWLLHCCLVGNEWHCLNKTITIGGL